ncbi:C2 domain-containing protein 3 isoform X2 [Syngnathoides biaculeatus]|uniref:C2 domain-containing protein 3 isoform X2 n=1 Tax=Syngnathoides biaculeatus TaxID=300417 RepID=UPI002ADD32A8|nr:C2 domain-containing protein 3 isoform X2 [Syngnathoides biaculeatus]
MKNRSLGSVKAGGTKKKVQSDVVASTSLPPLVEGEVRCFLRVTVSRLRWSAARPLQLSSVRLRWWGESSDGTHFIPEGAVLPWQRGVKTTARFPVRCGPKQLTSYLADMGNLVLEVLSNQDRLPIARAQVTEISRLSRSQPITGFHTLLSPTSKKLGELEVSLHLEPLAAECDKHTSGPSTEFGSNIPQGGSLATFDDPPPSDANKSDDSSGGNTLRGKDGPCSQTTQTDKDESVGNVKLQANGQIAVDQPSNDILSVILERGSKLRDAMVMSALKSDMPSAPFLQDFQLPLQTDSAKPTSMPSEMLLENIQFADPAVKSADDVGDYGLRCSPDMEHRAVDLILGRLKTSPSLLWQAEGSFPDSLSSMSGDSDLGDPQYDQSLLENLFYKPPSPDLRADEMAGDAEGQKNASSRTAKHAGTLSSPVSELQNTLADSQIPLSREQLTFLSFMRSAKVTIDSMSVPTGCASPPATKTPSKSPLLRRKKCTYFVEYTFPKTFSSGRHGQSVLPGVEVTRAASSNVTEGVVNFNQLSVFPVRFSKTAVEAWWSTDLLFRIYARKNDQKRAVLIGEAHHPLRSLLRSKQLSESLTLGVRGVEAATRELCLLKVLLELSTNNRVSEISGKREPSWSRTTRSPQREPCTTSQCVDICSDELAVRTSEDFAVDVPIQYSTAAPPLTHHAVPYVSRGPVAEEPEVLLHTLLMVPDGKNFTGGLAQAVNVYLNCKLFWCDEVARSVVSWGRANPSFNFVQVTPVALNSLLLERMRNNVMVIEVWQKTGSSSHERLFGLVKLPLHQFYMSFRDPKITHLLLQAQYPVLGVDCYMPVVDVFSGSCRGSLRVTLAMGLCEQVLALQRARDEECDPPGRTPLRPLHLLDHQPSAPPKVITSQARAMTEHVFMIRVEKLSGLTPLQSTVWGEADCYVQYTFPSQKGADVTLDEYNANLKPFRTTTTLCVPDPIFGHTEAHALLAPEGVPIQKVLLSSLSSQGLSGGGGVHFEVWCRYYYPNVRDQLVAKGILPLSKLCAMVTLQGRHPDEAQMFSLPLLPKVDGLATPQPHPSGLLDVCVRYKFRPLRADVLPGRGPPSSLVTLVVQVHRGSGLQAAARVIAQQDERFDYFATVGVNSYVTVHLSFLPNDEPTCTRTAARTFCPEFDHHAEVRCDILVHKSGGETCSLAEQLAEAWAVFTVWNKDSRKGITAKPPDVMLGTVKIPLLDLLRKTTGIFGWFSIYASRESPQGQHTSVGGLEISLGFSHHSERERVIRAAQDLGWDPTQAQVDCDDQGAWEQSTRKLSLTFSMPRAWLPLHCLFLPGHDTLQRSTYCYLRYKFYENEAYCSHMKHPCAGEGGQATVTFQGSRTVELMSSQPLMWYLREEKLEVQVWVAFQKDKSQKPRDTDRLLGSAFIHLSSLAQAHQEKLTLSGVYPLFRRSAADLQGAALRVHISLTAGSVPTAEDDPIESDSQEETLIEEQAPPTSPSTPPRTKESHPTADVTFLPPVAIMTEDESFPVTVGVHGAKNLNGCLPSGSSEGKMCCFVSYVAADCTEPISTVAVADTNCPVWDHEHNCRLSKQLLLDPQQSLVFKVWHKGTAEAEQVIGFAAVDLSPLLCGLRLLCGWYNVTDFSGHCHGQLKVSVKPLKWVQDLRGERKAAVDAEPFSQVAPCSYQTSAMYTSFPSHISRYPEQHISSPDSVGPLFHKLPVPSESERHHEHMEKVRLHHQSLQEQAAPHLVCDGSGGDVNPSSSLLFATIRKIMSEQDNIQRYFSSKLGSPAFPSTTDRDEQKKQTPSDTCLQLIRSPPLAGDGRSGQCLPALSSIVHGSSANENHPEMMSSSVGSSSCRRLPFPASQPEEEEDDGCNKEPEATDNDDEDDEEDDEEHKSQCSTEDEEEDYEEEVVEPRHLNEVTFSTDKTSPWNSILSDRDLPEAQDEMNSSRKQDLSQRRRADSFDKSSEAASNSQSDDGDTTGATAARSGRSMPENQVSLPNYFLPSDQLEASLKVVHLASSFSNLSSDRERGVTPHQIPRRGPWRCPDMSPTSRKRETERFARICATRLDIDDD